MNNYLIDLASKRLRDQHANNWIDDRKAVFKTFDSERFERSTELFEGQSDKGPLLKTSLCALTSNTCGGGDTAYLSGRVRGIKVNHTKAFNTSQSRLFRFLIQQTSYRKATCAPHVFSPYLILIHNLMELVNQKMSGGINKLGVKYTGFFFKSARNIDLMIVLGLYEDWLTWRSRKRSMKNCFWMSKHDNCDMK